MNPSIPWGNLVSVAIAFVVLIALNAFFVAGEYSLVLSRRTRMASLAAAGSSAARTVLKVMEDQPAFLSGVQIGITITAVALGAFSEKPLTEFIVAVFGLVDSALLRAASGTIGFVLSLAIASFLSIVLGELVPRALTMRSAERIALVCVPPLAIMTRGLSPFIWLLKKASGAVLRLFGANDGEVDSRLHSADELRMLVEESERGGLIESSQGAMLDKVFNLGDTTVREVMVPRTEMVCVDVDAMLTDVARVFSRNAYSRVPVYEESIDNIVGILHSKEMMRAVLIADRSRQPQIRQMMREPFFVPDSQKADELLTDFRKRRQYLAVVLDEFGGTAGLVTLSDLVARIIGDVEDSAEPASSPDIQHASDGSATINGLTNLGDFNEAFALSIVDKNYDTIGGYVMGRLGRIPRAGDVVELGAKGLAVRVEEMDKLRVARLQLFKK
jgi:CBS domain containing-hemolysin-like protein